MWFVLDITFTFSVTALEWVPRFWPGCLTRWPGYDWLNSWFCNISPARHFRPSKPLLHFAGMDAIPWIRERSKCKAKSWTIAAEAALCSFVVEHGNDWKKILEVDAKKEKHLQDRTPSGFDCKIRQLIAYSTASQPDIILPPNIKRFHVEENTIERERRKICKGWNEKCQDDCACENKRILEEWQTTRATLPIESRSDVLELNVALVKVVAEDRLDPSAFTDKLAKYYFCVACGKTQRKMQNHVPFVSQIISRFRAQALNFNTGT